MAKFFPTKKLGARHRVTQVRLTSFSLSKRLAHAQRKSRAALGKGFSRGGNKNPTTRQTRHANDFVNGKSHAREKPLLAG